MTFEGLKRQIGFLTIKFVLKKLLRNNVMLSVTWKTKMDVDEKTDKNKTNVLLSLNQKCCVLYITVFSL